MITSTARRSRVPAPTQHPKAHMALHTFAANGRGTADCLLLGGDTCHSTEHSFPGLLPAYVSR